MQKQNRKKMVISTLMQTKHSSITKLINSISTTFAHNKPKVTRWWFKLIVNVGLFATLTHPWETIKLSVRFRTQTANSLWKLVFFELLQFNYIEQVILKIKQLGFSVVFWRLGLWSETIAGSFEESFNQSWRWSKQNALIYNIDMEKKNSWVS